MSRVLRHRDRSWASEIRLCCGDNSRNSVTGRSQTQQWVVKMREVRGNLCVRGGRENKVFRIILRLFASSVEWIKVLCTKRGSSKKNDLGTINESERPVGSFSKHIL